jgi:hypothetical protein
MGWTNPYLAGAVVAALALGGCGGLGDSNPFGRRAAPQDEAITAEEKPESLLSTRDEREARNGSILNLFNGGDDPNTTVEVNKYIWQASLEVLNFLPIEAVDPFTGVFTTGYGRPPGGGRAYRATVYVQDPALDARSLKIALQGQGGGSVAPETVRAVEDAILTRARQLRVRDSRL